jgi:hypothetical protein
MQRKSLRLQHEPPDTPLLRTHNNNEGATPTPRDVRKLRFLSSDSHGGRYKVESSEIDQSPDDEGQESNIADDLSPDEHFMDVSHEDTDDAIEDDDEFLILVSYKDLSRCIKKSLCCLACSENGQSNVELQISKQTLGLANTVSWICSNGHCTCILPDSRYTKKEYREIKKFDIRRDSISDYNINYNLVVSMIPNGLGFSVLYKIFSTLGILTSGLGVCGYSAGWRQVQSDLCN